jgi:hypothetical protein
MGFWGLTARHNFRAWHKARFSLVPQAWDLSVGRAMDSIVRLELHSLVKSSKIISRGTRANSSPGRADMALQLVVLVLVFLTR